MDTSDSRSSLLIVGKIQYFPVQWHLINILIF